jgi:RES domain-containing protein
MAFLPDARVPQVGRWNSPGTSVIYAAETFAGAVLEVLVHANLGRVPRTHAVVEITIPGAIATETVAPGDLPGWDADDQSVSRAFGDQWLEEKRTAVLLVPSVVTRGRQRNVLLESWASCIQADNRFEAAGCGLGRAAVSVREVSGNRWLSSGSAIQSTLGLMNIRLVWLIIAAVLIVTCSNRQTTANSAAVQAAFRKFSQDLKPGATRKEVKDFLRSQGIAFFERCCYQPNGPFSVLVRVGEEEKSWFCSAWPEYVAFEFGTTEPIKPGIKPTDADSDVLKLVHLTSNGEGCL